MREDAILEFYLDSLFPIYTNLLQTHLQQL